MISWRWKAAVPQRLNRVAAYLDATVLLLHVTQVIEGPKEQSVMSAFG